MWEEPRAPRKTPQCANIPQAAPEVKFEPKSLEQQCSGSMSYVTAPPNERLAVEYMHDQKEMLKVTENNISARSCMGSAS